MADIIVAGNTSGAITISAPLVAGSGVLTLPTGTDTLVGKATTDTLTNKTLTAPTITGATITVAATAAPAFSAYLSSSQSPITTSTSTKIAFNTEEFDTNNNFAASRFTPTVAGYYQINARCAGTGTYTRTFVSIYKNGVEYKRGNDYLVSGYSAVVSSIVYCNGTSDYIEIYGWLLGSGLSFDGGATNGCDFNGAMIRSA